MSASELRKCPALESPLEDSSALPGLAPCRSLRRLGILRFLKRTRVVGATILCQGVSP